MLSLRIIQLLEAPHCLSHHAVSRGAGMLSAILPKASPLVVLELFYALPDIS